MVPQENQFPIGKNEWMAAPPCPINMPNYPAPQHAHHTFCLSKRLPFPRHQHYHLIARAFASASSLPCLPRLSGFAAAVQDLGAAACTSPGNEPWFTIHTPHRAPFLPANIALAHDAHFDAGAFAQHSRSTKPVTLGVTAF
ncbi:hypothetical protein GGP41_002541 [Bipolaris sorokiniana]|uniref:Uncharacterized protein n=1 Tax=Cochliobolus sativus TaxID=45130 RepID=A0A8H5ZHF4_COCSA|nr:hypothetical protein GGP41_002541 [Bipolaris sorokiniana]